jgi:hypothetical protein
MAFDRPLLFRTIQTPQIIDAAIDLERSRAAMIMVSTA